MAKPKIHLSIGNSTNVYEQLQREEALFRSTQTNWCIVVKGSTPSIVLGAFGQKEHLVDYEKWLKRPIPLVRRFSGGGTVVVDHNTLFVAWIFNAQDLFIEPYPQSIFQWAYINCAAAMKPVLLLGRENDFCLEQGVQLVKIAGNAQSIAKHRFVHHTSFLWDYQLENMQLLKKPSRQPQYRQGREHADFIYSIKSTGMSQQVFINQLKAHLNSHFDLLEVPYEELQVYTSREYRRATSLESW